MTMPANELPEVFFLCFRFRQKTEKCAQSAGRLPACELLRDPFRGPENISGVLIVILHEGFAAQKPGPLRIIQPPCQLFLCVQMQDIRAASILVMQIGAYAEQEIVG